MIREIILSDTASYAGRTEIPLKKLNFIYGSNGSGKTTISKVLKNPDDYPKCSLTWDGEEHEEVLVYNRPFVAKNFENTDSLLGIFTLGEESISVQHEIEELRKQISQIQIGMEGHKKTKKQLEETLNEERQKAVDACWSIQVKYGSQFPEAMSGGRNSKERFFQMCREAYGRRSEDDLLDCQKLQERYTAAYKKTAVEVALYSVPSLQLLEDLNETALLGKVITGKSDTPIGTFIQYLHASDWVKQGVALTKMSHGKCPYCQRELPASIAKEIEDFFDESYTRDCNQLKQYYDSYKSASDSLIAFFQTVVDSQYDFLNYDGFEEEFAFFRERVTRNLFAIQRKLEMPSEIVLTEEIYESANGLISKIKTYNSTIDEHNRIVQNQSTERIAVRRLIWRYLVSEIENTLAAYENRENNTTSGCDSLQRKIDDQASQIRQLNEHAEEKETTLTSVKPTVIAINRILEGFGFDGFRLAENEKKKGTYSVIRRDGTNAKSTLSEGEYNFLTFLYFYHLCFGSQSSSGLLQNKILVIDDPISSMDSAVLFIVSTLVKTMIGHCRDNEKGIKQIIVLTHNVYFHKEITYLGSRDSFRKEEVVYFILRKKNEQTSVEYYEDNPILSSYEMLWEDVRNPSSCTSKSVFNTMRRILEYYFTVIGGINYEMCISQFEGEDKLACKALVAYINDGSHSVYDDLIVPIEDSALENYQRIFKLIFEKLHHIEHYNMMMKIEP